MFESFFISCFVLFFFIFLFLAFSLWGYGLLDPKTSKVFKVNGERVRAFVEGINEVGDQIPLQI